MNGQISKPSALSAGQQLPLAPFRTISFVMPSISDISMPSVGPVLSPVPGANCAARDVILQVLAKETGINQNLLRLDARLSDLDIPSLDLVQAIFELESRFDIEIPIVADRSGAEFETVGQMVEHVQAAIDAAKPAASGQP